MLYSSAAILCLIPKWDENRGVALVGASGQEDQENVEVELNSQQSFSSQESLSPI